MSIISEVYNKAYTLAFNLSGLGQQADQAGQVVIIGNGDKMPLFDPSEAPNHHTGENGVCWVMQASATHKERIGWITKNFSVSEWILHTDQDTGFTKIVKQIPHPFGGCADSPEQRAYDQYRWSSVRG